MKKQALFVALVVSIATLPATTARAAEEARPVKVFVLAGQSNMEGKAANGLLEKQAAAPETKDLFKHLRKDGKWIVRDDVFVKFPELKGMQLEMAGFVWFQGWNDMLGGVSSAAYASNMEHFIRDVRKDLKAPKLPFVIAAIGNNGSKPAKGGMLTVSSAQLSMNDVPDFKGNVKAFRTDVLVDKKAEELFPVWRKRFKEWIAVASDGGYHYYGSAIWFNRIGKGMGEAMLELNP